MRYLLDTSVFLWFALEDEHLLPEHRDIIHNGDNDICISIASLWEIGIKHSLGKITIAEPIDSFLNAVDSEFMMTIVPVTRDHIVKQAMLPFHHRDPFDRLIIAQSMVEGMKLLYTDRMFDRYMLP